MLAQWLSPTIGRPHHGKRRSELRRKARAYVKWLRAKYCPQHIYSYQGARNLVSVEEAARANAIERLCVSLLSEELT